MTFGGKYALPWRNMTISLSNWVGSYEFENENMEGPEENAFWYSNKMCVCYMDGKVHSII